MFDVQKMPVIGTLSNPSGQYPETATQAVGQIMAVVQEQEMLIAGLRDEVTGLEARISPFLRPVPPSGNAAETNPPSPVRSDFAVGLSQHNAELYILIQRVRSLTARVDI